jgi:hypothetical protein
MFLASFDDTIVHTAESVSTFGSIHAILDHLEGTAGSTRCPWYGYLPDGRMHTIITKANVSWLGPQEVDTILGSTLSRGKVDFKGEWHSHTEFTAEVGDVMFLALFDDGTHSVQIAEPSVTDFALALMNWKATSLSDFIKNGHISDVIDLFPNVVVTLHWSGDLNQNSQNVEVSWPQTHYDIKGDNLLENCEFIATGAWFDDSYYAANIPDTDTKWFAAHFSDRSGKFARVVIVADPDFRPSVSPIEKIEEIVSASTRVQWEGDLREAYRRNKRD